MPVLTVRNLPDEVHRGLRVRAARRGRSTEAEVRAILEEAIRPEGRVKLGTLLAEIGRQRRPDRRGMGRLRLPRRDAGATHLLRMILVDTNVVSESLRRRPEPRVTEWVDAQPLETLYLSTVTVAELRFGVARPCQPGGAGIC